LRTHHLRLLACILAGAVLPGIVPAADLYRWVDDQGTPHVSDRPPPNPPANMTREALPSTRSTPQRQGEAQQRAQRGQEPVRAPESDRGKGAVQGGATPVSAPAGSQDCKARWDAYQRSQACFAPYRTADAGMKPEAFAACGPDLADPAPDCGPLR
jgi:hypothetical protein